MQVYFTLEKLGINVFFYIISLKSGISQCEIFW